LCLLAWVVILKIEIDHLKREIGSESNEMTRPERGARYSDAKGTRSYRLG